MRKVATAGADRHRLPAGPGARRSSATAFRPDGALWNRRAPRWPRATRSSTTKNEDTMSNTSRDILMHRRGRRAQFITFNRVSGRNLITTAMYAQLADAFRDRGAGRGCARWKRRATRRLQRCNDIATLQQRPARRTRPCSASWRHRHLPARGGCGPAARHDHAAALRPSTRGRQMAFSMPFVNLGLCPEAASSRLPQMMGYHRAADMQLHELPFMAEAVGGGPGQPRGAAHRVQRDRTGPGAASRGRAAVGAHRY